MVHNEDPTAKTKVLNVQKKLNWRAEKMAQWLMCLPHKPEDHDSDPWNSYKFWVISASEEQDQGNNPPPRTPMSKLAGMTRHISGFWGWFRDCLTEWGGRVMEGDPWCQRWVPHVQAYPHTGVLTQMQNRRTHACTSLKWKEEKNKWDRLLM